jgi:pyridoxine 4-dehydrogenase
MKELSSGHAAPAATFKVGGKTSINRLGYGSMRITGPGIWGPPDEPAEALRTLQLLPELGVNFIDTADSYGPDVSERLIREALHPYDGLLIATKAGFQRFGPDKWQMDGRPEHLRRQVMRSLDNLNLSTIALWQLHRIDPAVPRDEQFAAIKEMQDDGLIDLIGLSEVSVDDIKAASAYFRVCTVQNRYNLTDRDSEDVLEFCEANGIGFVPWFPLSAGTLARSGSPLMQIAARHGAVAGQIALAWLVQRSSVMLPIPGTSKRQHLRENVDALKIILTDAEYAELDALGTRTAYADAVKPR